MNSLNDILKLSLSERVLAVEAIWDSITADPSTNTVPLSDHTKTELDIRMQNHLENPTEGSSWQDVKSRILKK